MKNIHQPIEEMPTRKALVPAKISSKPTARLKIDGTEPVDKLLEKLKAAGILIPGVVSIEDLFAKLAERGLTPQVQAKMKTPEGKTVFEVFIFEKMDDFGTEGIARQSGLLQRLRAQIEDLENFRERLSDAATLREKLARNNGRQETLEDLRSLRSSLQLGAAPVEKN